jgi:ATP-dependent Zn protease
LPACGFYFFAKPKASIIKRFRLANPGPKNGNKDENVRTTFKDIAGIDEAVEELAEIVDFLKNPKKNIRISAPKFPKVFY